jgi:hypothetical protein
LCFERLGGAWVLVLNLKLLVDCFILLPYCQILLSIFFLSFENGISGHEYFYEYPENLPENGGSISS